MGCKKVRHIAEVASFVEKLFYTQLLFPVLRYSGLRIHSRIIKQAALAEIFFSGKGLLLGSGLGVHRLPYRFSRPGARHGSILTL
jgi:hypothetical protein